MKSKTSRTRSMRYFTVTFFIASAWTLLLISATCANPQTTDTGASMSGDKDTSRHADLPSASSGTKSSEAIGKVYKLPPPGEDPRFLYLTLGEEMFRERDFEKAREAFRKLLALDRQNVQAHYFLGLMEYEEGNTDRARARFRIAHETLSLSMDTLRVPIDVREAQLEIPDDYEARIYYKDGWYMNPKDPFAAHKTLYPLEAGSTYRVHVKSIREESWTRKGLIIGPIILLSFFLAR